MVNLPPIVEEKWEFLDTLAIDAHHIKVRGQEFFMFAAFGNLLFTPEEVETARKRFREWPNHTVLCPMWVLDRDDVIDSARRVGIQLEEKDFDKMIKAIRARIADTIGDSWDEILDEEVLAAKGEA